MIAHELKKRNIVIINIDRHKYTKIEGKIYIYVNIFDACVL